MLKIYDLKTEYRTNPVGIDAKAPRFSWKMKSDRTNVIQTSYRIRVYEATDTGTVQAEGTAAEKASTEKGVLLWDSGIVKSAQSQRIRYEGSALKSAQRLLWTVEVTAQGETQEGQMASEMVLSDPASFEMGLLKDSDWQAIWIQPEREVDYDEMKPAPQLRKTFSVKKDLVSARIYQSAHGLYEFYINGRPGTQDKFKPGLTSYYYRIPYQTYDITDLLKEGTNLWTVQLGDGWWRGSTGGGNFNNFGYYLSFIGQIVLTYADGSTDIIGTDESFKTASGALLRSDMKAGELYDARLETDWTAADFDDSAWENVIPAMEYPAVDVLVAAGVPTLEQELFEAREFIDTEGNRVLDFGQNHAGYVKMKLRDTKAGQTVTLSHGEGLKDGAFSTANIEEIGKTPFQQTVYICKGAEVEEYTPSFAIFGYRYVKIEGYEEEILPGDFVSAAVYSDLEETGDFTCSNPLVNQLVSNSRWSQKGNFLDAPTDCPTRERSTWSGDGQVYCKTASDFMNVYPFYEKWLSDLALEQFESGCVGNTFPATNSIHNKAECERMIREGRFVFAPPTLTGPEGEGDFMEGAAGWGDCAVIVPWTMYVCYGDETILHNQYDSAKKWVDFCRNNAKNENPLYTDQPQYHSRTFGDAPDAEYIYDTHFHWGEWLEPDGVENGGSQSFNPAEFAKNGNPLVATAYLYYSSTLLSKMASVLQKDTDAAEYADCAARVKTIYNKYFIKEDGTILEGRQAPYVRTLAFGLASEEKIPLVAAKLAETVEACGYTLNTGFLSTPFLLKVLAENGYSEHAFRLLEQTNYPSWLHPVTLGATTICENWGSMDDFFGSFNHYSYGAVCDFLFSGVGGISPIEEKPGYQRFRICPLIGGALTNVQTKYESQYGTIRSAWEKTDDGIRFTFEVPANTTARICLSTDYLTQEQAAVYGAVLRDGASCFTLGSGIWEI